MSNSPQYHTGSVFLLLSSEGQLVVSDGTFCHGNVSQPPNKSFVSIHMREVAEHCSTPSERNMLMSTFTHLCQEQRFPHSITQSASVSKSYAHYWTCLRDTDHLWIRLTASSNTGRPSFHDPQESPVANRYLLLQASSLQSLHSVRTVFYAICLTVLSEG